MKKNVLFTGARALTRASMRALIAMLAMVGCDLGYSGAPSAPYINGSYTATTVPTVNWSRVSGATGYEVYYGISTSSMSLLARTASTSYTHLGG